MDLITLISSEFIGMFLLCMTHQYGVPLTKVQRNPLTFYQIHFRGAQTSQSQRQQAQTLIAFRAFFSFYFMDKVRQIQHCIFPDRLLDLHSFPFMSTLMGTYCTLNAGSFTGSQSKPLSQFELLIDPLFYFICTTLANIIN